MTHAYNAHGYGYGYGYDDSDDHSDSLQCYSSLGSANLQACSRSKNVRQASISPLLIPMHSTNGLALSPHSIPSCTTVCAACVASTGAGWYDRDPNTASTARCAIALPPPNAIPCITVLMNPPDPPKTPCLAGGGADCVLCGGGALLRVGVLSARSCV